MKSKRLKRALALCAAMLVSAAGARAEGLALPDGLERIGAEAFAGSAAIASADIPEGVTSIGDRAFADCASLARVAVPASVTQLGEDVFDGCPEDLLILTTPGSAACAYARLHAMDYQADTVYRALLVGQSYAESAMPPLEGPENDIKALRECLRGFDGTPYEVNVRRDVSAEALLAAIDETFGAAKPEDVSLFYYSGHGAASGDDAQRGALVGASGEDYVTANQLRAALDAVPGRKIVVIDACYSGNMLSESAGTASMEAASDQSGAERFVDDFVSAFSVRKRRGLAADGYFVLTAAADNEESYEDDVGDGVMGLFTYHLVRGCGYAPGSGWTDTRGADADGNSVLVLRELYRYARRQLIAERQHVQVYPEDCGWFGIFR